MLTNSVLVDTSRHVLLEVFSNSLIIHQVLITKEVVTMTVYNYLVSTDFFLLSFMF